MKFSDYIDAKLINFLTVSSVDEAINILVNNLYDFHAIEDKDLFKKAITEREKISSTGIGMGVAIPHAKLPSYKKFFIAVGIQKQSAKGIEWGSIDNLPVRLIFMIGGPESKNKEYLQILSSLTKIIKDDLLRKKIILSKSSEEVESLLLSF